ALTLDDSGTTTGATWSVQTGSVSGPSPGTISFTAGQVTQMTLDGGSGGNSFFVGDTGPTTRINAGTGIDSVTVTGSTAPLTIDGQGVGGAAGSDTVQLTAGAGITGTVNIVGTTGTTSLVVSDLDSPTPRTA